MPDTWLICPKQVALGWNLLQHISDALCQNKWNMSLQIRLFLRLNCHTQLTLLIFPFNKCLIRTHSDSVCCLIWLLLPASDEVFEAVNVGLALPTHSKNRKYSLGEEQELWLSLLQAVQTWLQASLHPSSLPSRCLLNWDGSLPRNSLPLAQLVV